MREASDFVISTPVMAGSCNLEKHLGKVTEVGNLEKQPANPSTTYGKVTEVGNSETESQTLEKHWTYARRRKNLGRQGIKPKQAATSYLNPFDILSQEGESASLMMGTSGNGEEDCGSEPMDEIENNVTVETCEESNEESEFGTDKENERSSSDEEGTGKLKTLKDISIRQPIPKNQQVENLLKVSALLGVQGSKKDETKNIFSEIVEKDKSDKTAADRELAKLGWKGEQQNENLGRGKRTSAKKKK